MKKRKPQTVPMKKCENCYGTGTVWPHKTLGKGSRCPVCNGACKVPVEQKND